MSPPLLRDGSSGFWGYPTSTMDWCEENYFVTYYIAEFWNSISNLIFLIPPLSVLYYARHQYEKRYIIAFLCVAVVGMGSYAFHSTLLYHSQLLDELPMVYGSCVMLYCIIKVKGVQNQIDIQLASILTLLSVLITMAYVYGKNPLIFLWSYGFLAAVLFLLNLRGCLVYDGSKKLLFWGSVCYTFAFILWNIDNEYCHSVRATRKQLPAILKPMTQLHAWWHIFAGIGVFLNILYSLHLRIVCLGYKPTLQVIRNVIPYYVPALKETEVLNGKIIKKDIRHSNSNGRFY